MKPKTFVHVGCLQIGADYYLRQRFDDRSAPIYTKVKFVDITTCPAVIIVQDHRKSLIRCNRSDLYIPIR